MVEPAEPTQPAQAERKGQPLRLQELVRVKADSDPSPYLFSRSIEAIVPQIASPPGYIDCLSHVRNVLL